MELEIPNYSEFDREYEELGFLHVPSLLSREEVSQLAGVVDAHSDISAGDRRLLDQSWCRDLVPEIRSRLESKCLVPGGYGAILCTLFDKSGQTNWSVAPHRDLSIPVGQEFSAPGWQNWTQKQGIPYVQPPVEIVRRLFIVRVNIDECTHRNGALLVSPRSHKTESNQPANKLIEGGIGDALLMSPLLVHASHKAQNDERRRILHFLFGPVKTSSPLSWFYTVE